MQTRTSSWPKLKRQVRQLVKTYSCISADKQNLFQSERVIIGKCPRCSENVYEGKKNFYCGNRSCQFVMWKNDRFFEQRKKAFTPKIAAALLKNGKAKVKGLYSEKTGKTYDATVLLADTGRQVRQLPGRAQRVRQKYEGRLW